jgi:hypothetical protein
MVEERGSAYNAQESDSYNMVASNKRAASANISNDVVAAANAVEMKCVSMTESRKAATDANQENTKNCHRARSRMKIVK